MEFETLSRLIQYLIPKNSSDRIDKFLLDILIKTTYEHTHEQERLMRTMAIEMILRRFEFHLM